MNRWYFLPVVLFIIPLVQSCVSSHPVHSEMRNDPLIGKIIESKTKLPIEFKALIEKISTADVIYLSEKHDNPDQHAFQQKVIAALVELGKGQDFTPSLGFEFFAMANTPDLLNFVESGKAAHSQKVRTMIEKDLRMKLGWRTRSDESWQYYYHLLEIAQKENLAVAGLDLSSTLKKRITKHGINGITALEKEQIFSTHFADDNYKEYMYDIFKAVHCGMGHERMQSRLYDTWIARNDTMARSINMMHRHGKGPVIVIVGGGHTQFNLGIMDRLKAVNPDISQVNIGLTEISVQPSELADYLFPLELEGYPEVPPADFLYFTQRTSYEDPCERFKQSLERMKTGHSPKK